MRTAIIIHGKPDKEEFYSANRPSSSNCHWLPWVQKQLLLKDILAQTPEMPVQYNPEYNVWKEMFETFPLNEDTILVGHSCGGGFIVRYLSENNIKVGKVVLVAPWIDPEKSLNTGMFDFKIDENIVSKTNGITVFNSTNDMKIVQDSVAILKEKVKNLKVIDLKNRGHFCYADTGVEFPELLETLLAN